MRIASSPARPDGSAVWRSAAKAESGAVLPGLFVKAHDKDLLYEDGRAMTRQLAPAVLALGLAIAGTLPGAKRAEAG